MYSTATPVCVFLQSQSVKPGGLLHVVFVLQLQRRAVDLTGILIGLFITTTLQICIRETKCWKCRQTISVENRTVNTLCTKTRLCGALLGGETRREEGLIVPCCFFLVCPSGKASGGAVGSSPRGSPASSGWWCTGTWSGSQTETVSGYFIGLVKQPVL